MVYAYYWRRATWNLNRQWHRKSSQISYSKSPKNKSTISNHQNLVCWNYVALSLHLQNTIPTLFHTMLKLFLPNTSWWLQARKSTWINKQQKAMRNFKGNGTITANKLLEANECVCLCVWQWLRGVNRGISSHLRSVSTSHRHNWIKPVTIF